MIEWEVARKQFENLVKFAAKNVYMTRSNVDNSIAVEDLYQVGMIKLYDCWVRYQHLPMNEFKAVFNKTLFREVRREAKLATTVDDELAIENEYAEEPDYEYSMEMKESIKELESMLESPIAVAILHELVEPSPKTLWEVWADRARRTKLRKQGNRVNVPKGNDVRMRHIRLALEITQKQFDVGIAEIRTIARSAFEV